LGVLYRAIGDGIESICRLGILYNSLGAGHSSVFNNLWGKMSRNISGYGTILAITLPTLVILVCFASPLNATGTLRGTIKGRVVDLDTQSPLVGTTVSTVGTERGTSTNEQGEFTITDIPVGNYILSFSHLGYEALSRTDIIVKSKRITFVEIALKPSAIPGQDVVVTSAYFSPTDLLSTSTIEMSKEEIRRIPEAFGDINRAASVLPAVTLVGGYSNKLIVRGGNPIENGFIVDNIHLPTITHYPIQGSSAGGISLLNFDFIRDATFHVGGFPAGYGDRLSSFTNIAYRDGNREEYDGKLSIDFSGVRGAVEGPFPWKKGSWLFSARYSSLALLEKPLQLYTVPRYIDYQGKLTFALTPRDQLSGLLIIGHDDVSFTKEDADKRNVSYFFYGEAKFSENIAGINWTHSWADRGYSETSLAYANTHFDYHLDDPRWWRWEERMTNNSTEGSVRIRNINHLRLNRTMQMESCLQASFINNDYDNFYEFDTEPSGGRVYPLHVKEKIATEKVGAAASLNWQAAPRLNTTLGLRTDYFSYNTNFSVSPRLSLSYRLARATLLNAACGLYHQNLPLILLSQNETHQDLRDPRAFHAVLGITQLLRDDTRFTIEAYIKEYRQMPLDQNQPGLFVLDELVYRYLVFYAHEELIDSGQAFARGIELMLQKKLARKLYGMVSASFSRTRYRDADGIWRNRAVDNVFSITALTGYKPNDSWEFNLRWSYAGGAPYTPFDYEKSERRETDVFDQTRINAERLPPYNTLSLRIDKSFHLGGSDFALYLSVWNVYHRKNIIGYKWNEVRNRPGTMQTGGIVPIFGLEYEF